MVYTKKQLSDYANYVISKLTGPYKVSDPSTYHYMPEDTMNINQFLQHGKQHKTKRRATSIQSVPTA